MPRAVVDPGVTHHHELKSLPEGFVDLRQVSYGKWLQLRDESTRMAISAGDGRGAPEGVITAAQRKMTQAEFAACIADHNLEDANGTKLDFTRMSSIDQLLPRVGQEITELLRQLNNFEEEMPDFTDAAEQP